jgi:hypothetical protein
MDKDLREFLIKHNALEKYETKRRLNALEKYETEHRLFYFGMDGSLRDEHAISGAFGWGEDYDYWFELHKKWKEHLNEVKT